MLIEGLGFAPALRTRAGVMFEDCRKMRFAHSPSVKRIAGVTLAAAVAAAVAAPEAASAQGAWPAGETIRIVVPYAAGSNGDATGRVIAQYLGASLTGATIIV